MPDNNVYVIPLDLTEDTKGEVTHLTITIRVQSGNITAIQAVSGGKKYMGALTLHELSENASEGGDECIVCDPSCHVVSPCPSSGHPAE